MNILGLISQLIGIKTLRLTEYTKKNERGMFIPSTCLIVFRIKLEWEEMIKHHIN